MVVDNGYLFEEHKVTTDDGYVIKMFRIPGVNSTSTGSSSSSSIGPPVIMWHGVSDSSDTFFMNSADKTPGFIMANAGYDVWLPNSRGNKYSKQHTSLNASDFAFWDFSFEEISTYDTPSVVSYVLNVTGATNVAFIGHS